MMDKCFNLIRLLLIILCGLSTQLLKSGSLNQIKKYVCVTWTDTQVCWCFNVFFFK